MTKQDDWKWEPAEGLAWLMDHTDEPGAFAAGLAAYREAEWRWRRHLEEESDFAAAQEAGWSLGPDGWEP